eukprot:Skav215908  [mRNA]  locus=scaffold1542:174123:176941:+ [translate_table: standard]
MQHFGRHGAMVQVDPVHVRGASLRHGRLSLESAGNDFHGEAQRHGGHVFTEEAGGNEALPISLRPLHSCPGPAIYGVMFRLPDGPIALGKIDVFARQRIPFHTGTLRRVEVIDGPTAANPSIRSRISCAASRTWQRSGSGLSLSVQIRAGRARVIVILGI